MPSFHCMHVSHNHICISDSPNPYICIIAHVFPHYQIRISPPHFVGVFLYAGAINRPLQLLTVCQLRGEHSAKHSTNTHEMGCDTPPGVGADLSCPYPDITNCTYSHNQIRVYSLSNMHIHIIKYVFSSHHAHIFALPYQYIRFLLFIILNIKQPNTAYIYT